MRDIWRAHTLHKTVVGQLYSFPFTHPKVLREFTIERVHPATREVANAPKTREVTRARSWPRAAVFGVAGGLLGADKIIGING